MFVWQAQLVNYLSLSVFETITFKLLTKLSQLGVPYANYVIFVGLGLMFHKVLFYRYFIGGLG